VLVFHEAAAAAADIAGCGEMRRSGSGAHHPSEQSHGHRDYREKRPGGCSRIQRPARGGGGDSGFERLQVVSRETKPENTV